MNIAPLADVKAHFSEYIKKTQTEPVIVTKNGRPVAILIGLTDEDELERLLLATSPKFHALLNRSEHQIRESGGISHEDAWQQIDAQTRE